MQQELTTTEAAQALGVSERTIRNMIHRGSIQARIVKADPTVEKGVYKIPRSEIERIQQLQKHLN